MSTELNIGLTFSGGGYRAATFHLGALSFLNSVKVEHDKTLMDYVSVMSSVSGGTITALKYMLTRAQGKETSLMVDELFDFLCNEDLVDRALKSLSAEKANRNASSIQMMARIYDECLFHNAEMGDIIDHFDRIPVKDYTALATDFDNSLPFRFRLTEGRLLDGERVTYGAFGNQKHNIGRSVSRHITLGEALACSSCFPSGFEPMMYPDDFKVSQNAEITSKINSRFGIMDGGVVDNQGIDPVILAAERMHKYRQDKSRQDKALDLIIVSDVASPYMDGYAPCEQMIPDRLGKLTIGRLRNYGIISEVVVGLLFIGTLIAGSQFWVGVLSVILAIVTLLNAIGCLLDKRVSRAISSTFIGNRAEFIMHLKFASIEAMLMNRAKSVIMMSSEVFLKRMRKLSYDSIYSDTGWKNRIVSNAIYDLRPNERWQSRAKNGTLPQMLTPSDAIQQNSALAADMGTTLWFTAEDKQAGMPEALLAAGQYTMCYNLLKYIIEIEGTTENLTPGHQVLISLKPQLLKAWSRFQQDPHWMQKK